MIAVFNDCPCWRLVATRNPGVDIFQGLTDFGEWEELFELESLTNERLRATAGHLSALYDPDPGGYGPAQAFGAQVRARDGDGIVYASVRRPGGDCVAGFRPDRFSGCGHARLIQFHWDGDRLLGPDGTFSYGA